MCVSLPVSPRDTVPRVPEATFILYGRVAPVNAAGFKTDAQLALGRLASVVVLREAFWLVMPVTGPYDGGAMVREAGYLAEDLFGAYSMRTGAGLSSSIESWVEAVGPPIGRGSIVGVSELRAYHDDADASAYLAQAARDVAFAVHSPSADYWRAVFRDMGRTCRDGGDDAFLFAIRAIENAARATTGTVGRVTDGIWNRFARYLDVEPDDLKATKAMLHDARHAVAHGDVRCDRLLAARSRRQELLFGAREIAVAAFDRAMISREAHERP